METTALKIHYKILQQLQRTHSTRIFLAIHLWNNIVVSGLFELVPETSVHEHT